MVDTEGLVLKAKVHSAKVPEQDGLRLLLESARGGLSRLQHLRLDAGYAGRGRRSAEEVGRGANLFLAWSKQAHEPRDYERLCASAEAFVYAAMIRLMVRRLARA